MKTARTVAAIAKATRELEKRTKKPGAAEFSQVLAAAALPVIALPAKIAAAPLAAKERAVEQIALHAKKPLPMPGQAAKPKAERAAEKPDFVPPAPLSSAPVRDVAEPPPAAFVAQLPEDPTLRMTINPMAAAINVQTADGSDLSMYLRVRQGAAELRVEGAAAPALERRVDELRMVLAAEGISLKHIEVTPPAEAQQTASFSSDRERHAPPEPFERPDPDAAPASKPQTPSSTPARSEAGLHVRA